MMRRKAKVKSDRDARDEALLAQLRADSRQSVTALSRKTGMRPSTLHARIQRLRKRGVIERFTIRTNDAYAHESFIAFVFVTSKQEISRTFFEQPIIKEVFGVTGEFDLMIKVKCANVQEFNDFLLALRKDRSIGKTFSTIATIKIKEEI